MAEYHVGGGLAGIYAGTMKSNEEWKDKSDVTHEAIKAVAEYMLFNREIFRFSCNDKRYELAVNDEQPTATEPEPCEDIIKEISDASFTGSDGLDYVETLVALNALKKYKPEHKWETCFDCPLSKGCPKIRGCTNEQAQEYASSIPDDCPLSEQPERKKGKWIYMEKREPRYDIYGVKTWAVAYRCSECGFIHSVIEDFGHYSFCPNCSADMRGEQDG